MATMNGEARYQANHESAKSVSAVTASVGQIDPDTGYIQNIESIRQVEYPLLNDTIYLDHAGTTLYARSLIECYTKDLTCSLLGNPHSASASSQLSSRRIDDARLQVLRLFNADPEHFDVVFVANATAAIKLVAESFRDADPRFQYGYHRDAHTSLVGVRELTSGESRCLANEATLDQWISGLDPGLSLFGYPGQSNMTGDRCPLGWCSMLREASMINNRQIYSLYDAAGLLSTSALDLSIVDSAPDFTALSFYKIFGFPDLGALIIRKASGDVLHRRKYFAGGTVEMVGVEGARWHAKKDTLHDALEEGTLPFHSIVALQHAMRIHNHIYGSMHNISRHTQCLAMLLYAKLSKLQHGNNKPVCRIYSPSPSSKRSGPIVTFNLLDSSGRWISYTEVEKLAIVKGIQFRTGGLCNPGGMAQHLHLTSEELQKNFAAGQRCGGSDGVMNGKPTGAIRVSLGAMSSISDVERFIEFVREFYVDHNVPARSAPVTSCLQSAFFVESLSVFPIKSCAAFKIDPETPWEVLPKGLAWDREWCLVHQGTNIALSQKQYPDMALLQPSIDLIQRRLIVSHPTDGDWKSISISLEDFPETETSLRSCNRFKNQNSIVCGEAVPIRLYTSLTVSDFFSNALGVPCTLARYPPTGQQRYANIRKPRSAARTHSGASPRQSSHGTRPPTSIKLSNESPILLVSRSSVNRLNEEIKQNQYQKSSSLSRSTSRFITTNDSTTTTTTPPRTVTPDSFRANIVIAQNSIPESPYIEDSFTSIRIQSPSKNKNKPNCNNNNGDHHTTSPTPISTSPPTVDPDILTFENLGPCQRCQMVCVDQGTGKRSQEPFSTLAKTRRRDGGVWFGIHLCLDEDTGTSSSSFDNPINTTTIEEGNDLTEEQDQQQKKKKQTKKFVQVGDQVVGIF